jgi:hypothetical protein
LLLLKVEEGGQEYRNVVALEAQKKKDARKWILPQSPERNAALPEPRF